MFIDKDGNVRKPYAYLAGTEIFYRETVETQELYHSLCDKYGIIGLYPPDPPLADQYIDYEPKDDSLKEMEKKFFYHDVNQINRSDMIIANLNWFRGFEPDSGTAFECGYAYARGCRMFGFISDIRPFAEKYTGETFIKEKCILCDKDGMKIENFGAPVNLMFSKSMEIFEGGLEQALIGIRKIFDSELIAAGHKPFSI